MTKGLLIAGSDWYSYAASQHYGPITGIYYSEIYTAIAHPTVGSLN